MGCRGLVPAYLLIVRQFEGRPHLNLFWSVWMVSTEFGLPKVIFEKDYFFFFLIHTFFLYAHTLGSVMVQEGSFRDTMSQR